MKQAYVFIIPLVLKNEIQVIVSEMNIPKNCRVFSSPFDLYLYLWMIRLELFVEWINLRLYAQVGIYTIFWEFRSIISVCPAISVSSFI